MVVRLFDESRWSTQELKDRLKAMETALMNNSRQVIFKDQQVAYKSTSEIMANIQAIQDELNLRESESSGKGKRKKVVRVRTNNKGFQ